MGMSEEKPVIELPEKQVTEPRPGESIVISQATVYYFVIAILFFAAGFVVSWILFTTATDSKVSQIRSEISSVVQSEMGTAIANMPAGGNAVAEAPTAVPRQVVDLAKGAVWGPDNAKVTIIEFSDF